MSHELHEENETFYADGERTTLAHADGELLVERLCQRCGLNRAVAISVIGEMDEASDMFKRGGGADLSQVLRMFKRGLRIVRCTSDQKQKSDQLEYLVLALGWHDELPRQRGTDRLIDNPTDLARHLQVTKANSNKYVNLFRDVIVPGITTLPTQSGQRDESARNKFTALRYEQEVKKRK